VASGRASKRKRAAQRAQAAAVAQQQQRRRRLGRRWVLLSVVAAVALAVGVGVVLAAAGKTKSDPTQGSTLPNAADAAALFAGIPQQGTALGRVNAPVTVVEFVDLQCPFCREFAVESIPTLVEKHVRTGKARLDIRGLVFLGPDSERGMRAAFAASRQNRMFDLMELLYYNQGAENSGWLSQDLIEAGARSFPGLDVARLVDDMDSGAVSELLSEHADEAERRDVSATPTIFVGPTGGKLTQVLIDGPTDVAAVERAIAAAR
jgi:protein-disulfide isomerase